MNATQEKRDLNAYFRDFPMTKIDDDEAENMKKQKDRYDAINLLIINAFHDIACNEKISILKRSYLDDVLHPELNKFCRRVFDMAEKYYKTNGDQYRTNFIDFCKFFANSKNGKNLYEKLFKMGKMINYPLILDTLLEKDFDFSNSTLLADLIDFSKKPYNTYGYSL